MTAVPWHVWLSAIATVCGVGFLVVDAARRQKRTTARDLIQGGGSRDARELSLEGSAIERAAEGLLGAARGFGRRVTPLSVVMETDKRIAQAGLSQRWTADRFIAAKGLFALILFLAWFLFSVAKGQPILILVGAGLSAVGFFLPDLRLVLRAKARSAEIRYQLADITDQILIAVEAGASLDTAISRVAYGTDGSLQDEFRRMLQDVSFGMSRRDALLAMADRSSVLELRELLMSLAQSEAHGLSIGRILRVQASEIREKRRAFAEEEAVKVPVKITFPLILFILPCILAILLGPAVVRISQNINF